MEIKLVQIDIPWACFWFDVIDGRVTNPPPIARWMKNEHISTVLTYWKERKAKINIVDVQSAMF
jgi:hypothetical protein